MAFIVRCRTPDLPELQRPNVVPFQRDEGATASCVERVPQKKISCLCALPSNQLQSQLRHLWRQVGKASRNQRRFPAFHIFQQLLPGCWISTGYQDRPHRVERIVLQLTKRPETQGRPSTKARSRPKAVESGPSLHHMPVGFPTGKLALPKIGGHRSPTVAFVRRPWVVLVEACLSIRCQLCQSLAAATLVLVPMSETRSGGMSFPSRIPKQPKWSSTFLTRRNDEGELFHQSQWVSPGIHSALCRL